MRSWLGTILLLIVGTTFLQAQSAANYTASRTTGITYSSIISSGTSFTWRNGTDTDNNRSALTNIGFDFWFLGKPYTQFSANVNGIIDLDAFNTEEGDFPGSFDSDNEKFFYQSLTIAPMYDDLSIPGGGSLSGNIKYAVSGSFPNRILTVEWLNMRTPSQSNPSLSFQVKLYEGTGVIEFVYGTMTAGSASYSYTVGIHDEGGDGTPDATEALVQQTANTATFSNTAVFNLSTIPSSDTKIELTPPVASSPTNLSFTNIKWNRMTLNWTDNATNEQHYAIYRSDDGGTTFSFVDTVDPGTTSFTNFALSFNTSYQWRVCAVTEGGLSFSAAATQGTNSGLLTGTYTVGPSGTYTTLTDAIAAIRTDGVIGATVFELQSDYTSSGETFPINLLDSTWASAVKTITIRPASGATGLAITSSDATGTLRFNKANYFIIDGRPGGTGSSKELTIENSSTTGFAVEFKNMAANNTLQYCILKGVNTSAGEGVLTFTASAVDDYGSSNTTGNHHNVVTFNDIRDGVTTPVYGIVGGGVNGLPDSNNTISYNNVYNFYSATSTSRGIYFAGFTQNLSIIGNSLYQTESRTPTGAATVQGINISGTGMVSITVKDNYIGGTSANAGGTPMTFGSTSQFCSLIPLLVNSTTLVCSLENNTIKNISFSTNQTSPTETFTCIFIVGIDTAYVIGNTIGSSTGTGSIVMNSNSSNSFRGIYGFSGSLTISNNTIGSITTSNTTTAQRTFILCISVGTTNELATISGNTIGSTDTPNSINQSNANTDAAAFIPVKGIDYGPNGQYLITNNTVANINTNYASTSTNTRIHGIHISSSSARGTISGNTVRRLTSASQNTSTGNLASIIGISNEGIGDDVTISNNVVDSLSNTAASASVQVIGILNNGSTTGTNVVERNKVINLSLSSSSTASSLAGIYLAAGTATYKNNMVSIGDGLTTEYIVTGMQDATTDNNNSFYYNTIRVGGTGVGTTATNTYAFRRTAAGTDTVKDNIFINSRSNSSTGGKHYAYHISSTTGLTSDYNDISAGGTGGILGFSSSDRTTLSDWQSGTSKDANSVSVDVTFASNTDLHLSGGSVGDQDLIGTPIAAILTDYDNDTRDATNPYMGADEAPTPLPVELSSFTAAAKENGIELQWKTAAEVNNHGFEIQRRISGLMEEWSDGKHYNNPTIQQSNWERVSFIEGSGTNDSPKEYSFTDRNLKAGKYSYRLKQIDNDGTFKYSQEVEVMISQMPQIFALEQNYPNPFNPTTTIGFTLQQSGMTSLIIYDAIGREVATLVDENLEAGVYHQRTFNASNLASGIYFVRLQSGEKQLMKKMLLLK